MELIIFKNIFPQAWIIVGDGNNIAQIEYLPSPKGLCLLYKHTNKRQKPGIKSPSFTHGIKPPQNRHVTIAESWTGIIEGREPPGRTFHLLKNHMRLTRNVTRTVIFL